MNSVNVFLMKINKPNQTKKKLRMLNTFEQY